MNPNLRKQKKNNTSRAGENISSENILAVETGGYGKATKIFCVARIINHYKFMEIISKLI